MTTPIDISAIRPGDTVLCEGVVSADGLVELKKGAEFRFFAALSALHIVSHTPAPRPIAVGDRVRIKDGGGVGWAVIAVHRQKAWLERSDDKFLATRSIDELTLIIEPPR